MSRNIEFHVGFWHGWCIGMIVGAVLAIALSR
jgi:hypothetical protein